MLQANLPKTHEEIVSDCDKEKRIATIPVAQDVADRAIRSW